MINLLLLSCGTNACFHIAKTLKNIFPSDFRIVGADINEEYLVPTIIYLDSFYKVPYSAERSYPQCVENIIKNENIQYIIPSFDVDQQLFYTNSPILKKYGCVSFGTPKESLLFYSNKQKMNNFLKDNQFPTPKIFSKNEIENEKNYFIKPINGVGSIGAKIEQGKKILDLDMDNFLIQEVCYNPEITMECFYYDGKFSSICRERITTKSGVCTKARIFNDECLSEIGKQFASSLKTPYFFNLQFMYNSFYQPIITDVNLRTAGGMSISYAAGWDEVSAIAKIMLKKTTEEIFETLPNKIDEQFICRGYQDVITKKIQSVVAFDLDGTLLDSRKRHVVVLSNILEKKGIQLDCSDLIEYKRKGKNNIDYLISKGIEQQQAKLIQKEWVNQIENSEFLSLDKLYPDTFDLLEKYKNAKKILITSRSNEKNVRKQIENLGISKFLEKIYVVNPTLKVAEEKAKIIKSENVSLFVGDTKLDYQASKIAKVDFEFRENGFNSENYIMEK